MARWLAVLLLLTGMALALTLALRSGRDTLSPPETPGAATDERAEVPDVAVDDDEVPAGQELPRIPASALADSRDLGTGESPEVLARLPTEIDYPLQEKYAGERWSQVPHELIAAHDGLQGHEGEGARRLFIALVAPGLPDAELERLVRDLRARHREAEALRVRVFDSREAATRPSWTDGGSARKAHLVADLYRDAQRETLRVRGREVEP